MKINSNDTSVNGTSLKGYVGTTYDKLVKLFGEPLKGSDDGKTTCEWILEFEDGTVATIYDWKQKQTPKDHFYWSVGGYTYEALEHIKKDIGLETKQVAY
ncbi:MAG: hypothetical protein RL709_318 [Pseudomonadota bacterium]|jgi:hypothetical protein